MRTDTCVCVYIRATFYNTICVVCNALLLVYTFWTCWSACAQIIHRPLALYIWYAFAIIRWGYVEVVRAVWLLLPLLLRMCSQNC